MRWFWMKLVVSFTLATLIHQISNVNSCMKEERLALLQIRSNFKSQVDPISYNGWLDMEIDKHNCCSWEHVVCNSTTQRVIELHLSATVFRDDINEDDNGEINASPLIFNLSLFHPFIELRSLDLSSNTITSFQQNDGFPELTKLRVLDISTNYINGSIPELGNLTQLQRLNLETNRFTHGVQGVCKLKNLEELRLGKNQFSGDFPSCLHNLNKLQVLDISRNHFKGFFPKFLFNFTSLRELDITDNYFHDKLSLSLFSNHSKLINLQLSRNNLEIQTEDSSWQPTFQLQQLGLERCDLNKPSGFFPKFLLSQKNLHNIVISNNNLSGRFPSWLLENNSHIQDLDVTNNSLVGFIQFPKLMKPSLNALSISGNHFQGRVPKNIGLLFPNLLYLDMSINHFKGQIPTSIGHLGQLWLLDLSNNNLSGEVPMHVFSRCSMLGVLKLSDNKLHGEAIPKYMNLPMLILLKLSNNHFSGNIKTSLLNSPNLISLDIFGNKLTGTLPRWIGNLSVLKAIAASKNLLKGEIPEEICSLSLTFLDLSQNNFTGTIPSCSNFSSLLYMHLHNNSLSGPIPNALSSLSSLRALDLKDNKFSGSIPLWINKLWNLRILLLAGNNLHNQIPHQICHLQNMNILDLSRNHFSGEIPTCLWNMSFGKRTNDPDDHKLFSYEFSAENNHYLVQETVDILTKNQYLSYVGSTKQLMAGLDLSLNNFSGTIPSFLGNLTKIHSINLSHNSLSRSIPSSFSNLKQVESLDLSYNMLSGDIPPQLDELTFLAVFNVSYNKLTGRTPDSRQFANFDEYSYVGNLGLCGPLLKRSCNRNQVPQLPPTRRDSATHGGLYMEDFLWSFSVSSIIALMTTLMVLYINPQWRGTWFNLVETHILWWLPFKLT